MRLIFDEFKKLCSTEVFERVVASQYTIVFPGFLSAEVLNSFSTIERSNNYFDCKSKNKKEEDLIYIEEDEYKMQSKRRLRLKLEYYGLSEELIKEISEKFGDKKFSVLDADLILTDILSKNNIYFEFNTRLITNNILDLLFE